MKKLALLLAIGFVVRNASAQEIEKGHFTKTVDFSKAILICEKSNDQDFYLEILVDDIELWANQELKTSERECYDLKFNLEDLLKLNPQYPVTFTEVEIKHSECDRKGNCHDTQPDYQTRLSAQIATINLKGYQKIKAIEPSQPYHANPHAGCEYMGALMGGWDCP